MLGQLPQSYIAFFLFFLFFMVCFTLHWICSKSALLTWSFSICVYDSKFNFNCWCKQIADDFWMNRGWCFISRRSQCFYLWTEKEMALFLEMHELNCLQLHGFYIIFVIKSADANYYVILHIISGYITQNVTLFFIFVIYG